MAAQVLQHEHQAWPSWVGYGGSSSTTAWRGGSESWEVRAFAEDASSSGQWPPRSYSCSFCQREFRTAQALGGHMNVHRRERAHANQLASIRNARFSSKATTTTVDLLSPKSDRSSSSEMTSSPESINSVRPFFNDIFSETLTQQQHADHHSRFYHPYDKSCTPARSKPSGSQGRFSLCLNKVMGERYDDSLVDLELRLGPV